MRGLSGSVSVKNKTLTATITNPSVDSPVHANIRLTNGSIVEFRGSVLTHGEMTAGNTFDRPNEVKLLLIPVNVRGNRTEIAIPPRAVVSLELKMV